MAKMFWGHVYFEDIYAGRLQQEPGDRSSFSYDSSYLEAGGPPIAHTLPLRERPSISEKGLPPFFDNLIAEGWLKNAQARSLGLHPDHRFELLLGFGFDLAGAVSVRDPDPGEKRILNHLDEATAAALLGRASLSGIQKKLMMVKEGRGWRPTGPEELSTHIAKLASGPLTDLIELEYLTTEATRILLPGDDIVSPQIVDLPSIKERALLIARFDRVITEKGVKRIHFEEFNQLLDKPSGDAKYEGAYEDMGRFLLETPGCIPAEADRLLRRILACLLAGNTDAHFKNFALFHTRDGFRLTPAYDLVASSLYPEYQTIALRTAGIRDLALALLKPKHLLSLGKPFGSNEEAVVAAVEEIGKRLPKALETIARTDAAPKTLREKLIRHMEKRWKGSFTSTGPLLSKRRGKGAKRKS